MLSLAAFFAVVFGLLLWIIRRRKRRSGNVVRDRIQRMQANQDGAVEPEEAGFDVPDQESLQEGQQLRDVDEFGLAPPTASGSRSSRTSPDAEVEEPESWLSSTTASGTKSYLGGWFGLDAVCNTIRSPGAVDSSSFACSQPSIDNTADRGSRDERLKAIQDSMRRKERMRVADEDDSDTATIRGDGGENEVRVDSQLTESS